MKLFIFSSIIGAIGGGMIVAITTNAIPKIISSMMSNMMEKMAENGCSPVEM